MRVIFSVTEVEVGVGDHTYKVHARGSSMLDLRKKLRRHLENSYEDKIVCEFFSNHYLFHLNRSGRLYIEWNEVGE